MGAFGDKFERYLSANPSALFQASEEEGKREAEAGRMASFGPDAWPEPDDGIDDLARQVITDPNDVAEYLHEVELSASEDADQALGVLATFGEVLKRLVRRIRRIPRELGVVFERLRQAVAAVARKLGAATFSVGLDLPWSFSIGLSWTPS